MKNQSIIAVLLCCVVGTASGQDRTKTTRSLGQIQTKQAGERKATRTAVFPVILGETTPVEHLPVGAPTIRQVSGRDFPDNLKPRPLPEPGSPEQGTSLTPMPVPPAPLPARETAMSPAFSPSPLDCGEACDSSLFGAEGCVANQCATLFSSHDVLFFRPRISGVTAVANVASPGQRLIDGDYEAAIRNSLEYRPNCSFGLRGTFQRYDHSSDFAAPLAPAELGIQTDVADIEVIFHEDLGRWNLSFSGGVEYGLLRYSSAVATPVTGAGETRFEGVGPVLGLRASHEVGDSSFAFYGAVKGAFLMGSVKNRTLLLNLPTSEIKDESTQRYQAQVGVAWTPDLFENCSLTIQGGWETQAWVNSTLSDDSTGIGSNLTLSGPAVSAIFSY